MNIFEQQANEFRQRHIGPSAGEIKEMLQETKLSSIDELIQQTVPADIRMKDELAIPAAMNENQYLQHIKEISLRNKLFKSYIGQGYYDTITPSVIVRNIFKNP
ncbi:MAG: glycine dehydrogenase (aminomethyl-transferring), partial [Chitinophagaceae bacterium]|nr:glycine dehydrogenase (aminomethyl-transferring) [Chitinophagaceae bacterium]